MSLAESFFNSDRSLLAASEIKHSAFVDRLSESPARSIRSAATAIVFIDANVSNAATLMAGVQPGTEVHLLDRGNAIEQITQTLLGRNNIASLHIVSHGQSGGVLLGETWLGAENLDRYADQLRSWGGSLTESADILLYGCDVAEGERGRSFVDSFSQLTGAEVAASDDLTGKGGDWMLEVQTGAIETTSPFQTSTLAAYDDALNVIINEWSQGSSGNKEWVELLVTAPTDLRGWTLADETPGNTYTTFSNSLLWQNVAAGTLIVIYNGGDRDTAPFPTTDDTDFSDGNFQIVAAHTNLTLFTTPTSWSGFNNTDINDNPILRNAANTIVHDWDQSNNAAFTAVRPGGTQSIFYTGNTVAGVTTSGNYSQTSAGSATPGIGSGGANTTWINSLRTTVPTVALSSPTATATETGANGTYRIARTGGTTPSLTVKLTLNSSSTVNSTTPTIVGNVLTTPDYTLTGGTGITLNSLVGNELTVTLAAGTSTADLTFAAINDIQAEASEFLRFDLVNTADYDPDSTNNTATATIAQNDFVVINTTDNGEGSLRQAILNANAIAGTDTITFAGSTFTNATPDTITLTTGQLAIASDLTITGTGANLLTLSGNNASRVFSISSGNVNLSGMTIANGNAGSGTTFGGGISFQGGGTLNLSNSVIRNNITGSGGGGLYVSRSSIVVTNTIIQDNTSGNQAGGINNEEGSLTLINSTVSGNTANGFGAAGGILNISFTAGRVATLNVNNSTFSGNNGSSAGGGAITNYIVAGDAITTVTNSTLSGNRTAGNGGAIWNQGGTFNLNNVTVTNNRADSDNNGVGDGGGILREGGTVTIRNTIIAGNIDGTNGTVNPDVSGTFTDSGNNLIGNTTGSTSFTTSTLVGTAAAPINPLLAPLANNGGSTQTHSLLPGSPAINRGTSTGAPTQDQRGIIRTGAIDIGALELQNVAPVITLPSGTVNYIENATPLLLDPTAIITDADNPPNFNTGVLTVSFSANVSADDRLAIQNQGTGAGQIGISDSTITFGGTAIATFTGGTGTTNLAITFNTNATIAAVEALLRNLTYANVSDAPSALDRTVSFIMTDGAGGTSTATTKTISVTSVNDAPSFAAVNQRTRLGQQVIPLSLWTRNFNLGPEETDQSIDNFIFTNSNPGMFTEFRFESDGTLVFTASNALLTPTTATINVRVRDDGGTANGGINESTIQTFTITVVPPPRIVIENVSRSEGNSGTTSFDFNVSLSHQSLDPVTVRYGTEDMSARVADRDYASTFGSLSFAPGELRKAVTVRVIGDTKAEPIEQFLVRLNSPTNGIIQSGIAIGTIFTDDSGSWIGSSSATATSFVAPLLSSPTTTPIAALRSSSPIAPTPVNLLRIPNLTLPSIVTVPPISSLSNSTNLLQQNPNPVKKTVSIDDDSTVV
ncbi:MAG: DUF4347 domain-containing protein [Phormidium tanganyikae FI6-MK23]|jgi:hypothetical protein|nr:DUF4347 domain-containing protein [Phormidium tanganyikae FI6-MK23]